MASNIVKLNIGGTAFQTSKSTLTRFGGFFKTILETEVPVAKDQSGSLFIDRDATHFRLILNFMRDGEVELPNTEKELKEILKEAQYYLLEGLVELCKAKFEPVNTPKPSGKFQILKTYDEVFEIIHSSETPVLIIYYFVGAGGFIDIMHDFLEFIKKYENNFKIYLKKMEPLCDGDRRVPYSWQCSVHSHFNKHRYEFEWSPSDFEQTISRFLKKCNTFSNDTN